MNDSLLSLSSAKRFLSCLPKTLLQEMTTFVYTESGTLLQRVLPSDRKKICKDCKYFLNVLAEFFGLDSHRTDLEEFFELMALLKNMQGELADKED